MGITQMIEDLKQFEKIVSDHEKDKYGGWERMNVQATPLYDCLSYTATTDMTCVNSQLFTNVGYKSKKSLAETNLTKIQKLCEPEWFYLQTVRFIFGKECSLSDISAVTQNMIWELWIGQKPWIRTSIAALDFVESPSGVQFECKVFPRLAVAHWTSFYVQFVGDPIHKPNHRLHTFKSDFRIWCYLQGLYAKGVS